MSGIEGIAEFAYEAGYLKRLPRSGWLIAGVRDPESVAEHSFRVAILAYVIAQQEDANPERAAVMGLFHDFPEARTGDVPSVGRAYVRTVDASAVIRDQTAVLPERLAVHIARLVDEHESASHTDSTLEAKCSRDADRVELLLQAREYRSQGNMQMQRFIESMIGAVTTDTGRELVEAALKVPPSRWWDSFAARFGQTKSSPRGD